jgi:hypothetical protein
VKVSSGMKLKAAARLWKRAGGVVRSKNATGEWVFSHPLVTKPICVNCRKKDAPRALTSTLRRIV